MYKCISPGMPRLTNGYGEMEFVVTPVIFSSATMTANRSIFTNGRDWPDDLDPTFLGYSIGRYRSEGRYDVREVEMRGPFKGRSSLLGDFGAIYKIAAKLWLGEVEAMVSGARFLLDEPQAVRATSEFCLA